MDKQQLNSIVRQFMAMVNLYAVTRTQSAHQALESDLRAYLELVSVPTPQGDAQTPWQHGTDIKSLMAAAESARLERLAWAAPAPAPTPTKEDVKQWQQEQQDSTPHTLLSVSTVTGFGSRALRQLRSNSSDQTVFAYDREMVSTLLEEYEKDLIDKADKMATMPNEWDKGIAVGLRRARFALTEKLK
jgi:hypothetical protein